MTQCRHCGNTHAGETCPEDKRVGELLGEKYLLERLLGEGGMGAVYLAKHQIVGRRFAIKFLHADLAADAQMLARFRREAQAAGALESENIAAVTDFGTAADGSPYIVMEYLEGEDVASLIQRTGELPLSRVIDIVIQACRGLSAAHRQGIIHRDLKPENLFVCKRGDGTDLIKVLDFGIAKLRQNEVTDSATITGMTLGTPYYMSPEQAQGLKDIDQRADVYALGVILYELLTGRKPHVGDGYNAIIFHILMKNPEPLATLRPDLPSDIYDIVERALARDPAKRFASADELASALAPFAAHATLTSTQPIATARVTPAHGVQVTQPIPPVRKDPGKTLPVVEQSAPARLNSTFHGTARSEPQLQTKRRGALFVGIASAVVLLGAAGFGLSRLLESTLSEPTANSQASASAVGSGEATQATVNSAQPTQKPELFTPLVPTPTEGTQNAGGQTGSALAPEPAAPTPSNTTRPVIKTPTGSGTRSTPTQSTRPKPNTTSKSRTDLYKP